MTEQADKMLAWCERYYRPKGAEKFSIVGREWVRDQIFVPALGWKLWPANPDKLCEKCADRAGEFVDWSPKLVRSLKAHRGRSKACAGLRLIPNMVSMWNLDRGAGKTSNMFGVLASILAAPELAPLRIQFMAAAGSQTDTLIKENLIDPIGANRALAKRFNTKANRVEYDHGKRGVSYLEFVETSHRSNAGRRRDILAFDEGRDIYARAFASALPSLRARSRFVCPRGHQEIPYEDDITPRCKVCRADLFPKIPRVLLPSTSGLEDGGEYDWFDQTVESRLEDPVGYCHVFKSDDAGNPSASKHETDMMEMVFADVPGLADYLSVELNNQSKRKGADFISKGDIRRAAVIRESLPASMLECVAWLDTSWSGDKTSLVIAGWDPEECESPWQVLRVLHWTIWDPAEQKNGVINPEVIKAQLEEVVPLFPALRTLMVDDRGMTWAKDLVIWCNRERAATWGHKVKLLHGKRTRSRSGRVKREGARLAGVWGGEEDRSRGWQMLHYRLLHPPEPLVLIPTDAIFEQELRGVTRITKSDGTVEIRDRNRRKRHADVVDSLAGCCLLAYLHQTRQVRTLVETRREMREEKHAAFKPLTGGIDPRRFF